MKIIKFYRLNTNKIESLSAMEEDQIDMDWLDNRQSLDYEIVNYDEATYLALKAQMRADRI